MNRKALRGSLLLLLGAVIWGYAWFYPGSTFGKKTQETVDKEAEKAKEAAADSTAATDTTAVVDTTAAVNSPADSSAN